MSVLVYSLLNTVIIRVNNLIAWKVHPQFVHSTAGVCGLESGLWSNCLLLVEINKTYQTNFYWRSEETGIRSIVEQSSLGGRQVIETDL
ncbi:unnamed protein product [Nezara viridula]|uniref:Uncharacterized protein n=1 Tax=Nezara viridula TaxID=85310 RepID=A0A9P0HMT2_NEZVI|nr:unnamed protein product [Nezara viridula]